MPLILALISSYLLGSLPTAYLVIKRLKGVDIRQVGSGNVGATNVTRTAGFKAGVLVFLVDAAKGLIAARIISAFLPAPHTTALALACGLAAALGHVYPVFLGFKGGKGFATMIGSVIGASPAAAVACLLIWMASFLAWRYASVSSILAAFALPIVLGLLHETAQTLWLASALGLLITVKHENNIRRLLAGTEHRWGQKQAS